ncbi:MAG: helix-turn-helix transcriptional regulator [Prevotella sp.]|nr:helix-turn-helix transcriptional regulator [Prevotella sp.]
MSEIKDFSLARLLQNVNVPCIDDDLLIFEDISILPKLKEARRMNFLFIGICTQGSGSYKMNQTEFKIRKDDALIITEGEIITDIQMSEDFKGFALMVSYRFVLEIVKDVQNMTDLFILTHRYPVFHMESDEVEIAKEYLYMILKRVCGNDYRFRKDVVRLLILTMIYDLGKAFYRVMKSINLSGSNKKSEQIFLSFIQLVEKNFRRERRVGWYAEQLKISPKYLSETISNVSNRTPNEWITNYVTTELRNILRTTNKRIAVIAEEMNFPNQSFLGKYFRENVGVSPLKYRRGKM